MKTLSEQRRLALATMAVAVVAAAWVVWLARGTTPFLYDMRLNDAWFGADVSRRYDVLSSTSSIHVEGHKHPLFAFLHFPAAALEALLRNRTVALITLLAVNGAIWAAMLFRIIVELTERWLDALVYTALGLASATGVFWLPTVETYAFGSTSILLVLLVGSVAALARSRVAIVIATMLSAGVTITNAMFGALLTWFERRGNWRRFGILGGAALGSFGLLVAIHALLFSHGPTLVHLDHVRSDVAVFAKAKPAGQLLRAFFCDALTPSTARFITIPKHALEVRLRNGNSFHWPPAELPAIHIDPPPTEYEQIADRSSGLTPFAHVIWIALLVGGAVAMVRRWRTSVVFSILALGLALQLALHAIYGQASEMFIYSAHWLPALVIVAGLNAVTRWRTVALVLVSLLTVYCAVRNVAVRTEANHFLERTLMRIEGIDGVGS